MAYKEDITKVDSYIRRTKDARSRAGWNTQEEDEVLKALARAKADRFIIYDLLEELYCAGNVGPYATNEEEERQWEAFVRVKRFFETEE